MNKVHRNLGLSILLLTAFIALFFGCGKNEHSTHEGELETLDVRLGWLVNANSAGQIAALEEGFYEDVGLNVRLHDGGLAVPSVKSVASGADQIGFANGPELVIAARAAGAPLVIVAVIHERGYHGFFVRADGPIKSPADWEGKRVGIKAASPTYLHYQALISKLNLNSDSITEVPLGTSLLPFINGEIDVYPGAKTNEAIALQKMGIEIRSTNLEAFGIPTMGNVIFTTEKFLRTHPETVKKFVQATMKGWGWCRQEENHVAALDHLQEHNANLDRVKESEALKQTQLLVGDGSVNMKKMGRILDLQLNYRELPKRPRLEDLVANPIEY